MAAADMMVTVAGAGDKSGSTWANAMSLAEFIADVAASAEAGDRYFLEEGTYTLTEALTTALDGTTAALIQVIGVLSGTSNEPPVLGDYATFGNLPLIAATTWATLFGDYWANQNIKITSAETSGLSIGAGSVAQNCTVEQTKAAASYAVYCQAISEAVVGCDLSAANAAGQGVSLNTNGKVFACYIHDSGTGVALTNDGGSIINCVIETIASRGIDVRIRDNAKIIGNTLYGAEGNSATAIYGTTGYAALVLNNIISNWSKGVEWTTPLYSNWFDYNCWYANDDDIVDTDVVAGVHLQTGNPVFTDETANPPDFTVTTGGSCGNAALDAGDNSAVTI